MEHVQGETQGEDRGPGGLLHAAVMSTQREEMAPLGGLSLGWTTVAWGRLFQVGTVTVSLLEFRMWLVVLWSLAPADLGEQVALGWQDSLLCPVGLIPGQCAVGEVSDQRPTQWFPVLAPSPPETQLHFPCMGSLNALCPYNKCSLLKSLSGSLILAIKRGLTEAVLCSDLADPPPGMIYNPFNSAVKNPPALQETRFYPWVRKIPWRRRWQRTPVFVPGKPHGWRSLAGNHGVAERGTRPSIDSSRPGQQTDPRGGKEGEPALLAASSMDISLPLRLWGRRHEAARGPLASLGPAAL